MKKLFCLLLTALSLLALCACGQPAAAPAPSEAPAPAEPALSAESPAPADLPSGEAPGTPASPDPAAQEQLDRLGPVLAHIRENVSIATAGSSLRAAAAAAELLDWAEETARSGAELSDAQLSQALAPWLAEADDALPASFAEQLGAVAGSCRSLRDAPEEGARGLLSDAGCESAGYPWSEEAYALAERLTALAGPADGQIGN